MALADRSRIAQGIRKALADNVPDDQILEHLKSEPAVADGVNSAMADGVPAADIVNHLGRLKDRGDNPYIKSDPTKGMSGREKFRAGAGKAFVDIGRGVSQLTGLGDAGSQQEIDDAKQRDAALMQTGAGMAGNIAGNIALAAPAMAVPGANTVVGSALIGAAQGALQPVASDESRAGNVAMGAITGAVGSAVPKGIGRMVRPNVRPEVKTLMDEGVTPTMGQVLGGAAQRIEDAATSVPIVGDAIKSAQRRGIEQFNRAAINRALRPIEKAIDKGTPLGRETIDYAHRSISSAYDELLPKLTGKLDDQLVEPIMAQLNDAAGSLPEAQAKQFENLIKNRVIAKFGNDGSIDGTTLKEVHSFLGTKAREYGRAPDPDQRALGEALGGIRDAMRSMIERQNPQFAGELGKIDSAYSMLLRIENAAGRVGAKEGVFTPAQLTAATKALDPSMRKSQFARGNALMQDLAEAGKGVLSQTVPDSGTASRLIAPLALGGGAGFAAHEGWISPETAIAVGVGSAAYSKVGQKVIAAILTKRPELIEKMSPNLLEAANIARGTSALAVPAYRLSND